MSVARPLEPDTGWNLPHRDEIEAVVRVVLYGDVFDFAVTRDEIHRYLELPVPPERVDRAIEIAARMGLVRIEGDLVSLAGRPRLAAAREAGRERTERTWRWARRYARLVWTLPFVSMIAVSGSLAAGSTDGDGDIDYFVVTAPGRLWLTRGMIVVLCRVARLLGHVLCPNYLVTTEALTLDGGNLYAAREMAQLVVLHGRHTMDGLRASNRWCECFLPNAHPLTRSVEDRRGPLGSALRACGEWLLSSRLGDALERWERSRKVGAFTRQLTHAGGEAVFGPDVCKGHDHGHAHRVLSEYELRLERFGLSGPLPEDTRQPPHAFGEGAGHVSNAARRSVPAGTPPVWQTMLRRDAAG